MSQARQIRQEGFYRSSRFNDLKRQEFGRHVLDHEHRGVGLLENRFILPGADKVADASRKTATRKMEQLSKPTTREWRLRKGVDDARAWVYGHPTDSWRHELSKQTSTKQEAA